MRVFILLTPLAAFCACATSEEVPRFEALDGGAVVANDGAMPGPGGQGNAGMSNTGAAPGNGGSSGGGNPGGAAGQCTAASCPSCQPLGTACCKDNGGCGCKLFGLFNCG